MLHDLENRRTQMTSSNNLSYRDLSFIPTLSNSNKFDTAFYVILFLVVLTSFIVVFTKNNNADHANTLLSDTPIFQPRVLNIQQQDKVTTPVIAQSASQRSPVSIKQDSTHPQQAARVEVATSVIHQQDKVVITKIPMQQSVDIKPLNPSNTVGQIADTKKAAVYKRHRALSTTQQAENLYQSAYQYLLANNHQQAQEELRNALMIMPGHNKSRELLAGIYIKNGRIVEARTLLQYGLRISPSHFIFAKLYARILMEQNDNVTAISVLLRNPPAQNADSDYFALLAALYQKNKQHFKAAALYGQLLKQRENNGVWWLGMAISLEALDKSTQARLAYEKAKNSGNLSKGLYQYTDQRVIALEEISYP